MTNYEERTFAIRIVPTRINVTPGCSKPKFVTHYKLFLTNGASTIYKRKTTAAKYANDIGWWVGPKEPE